MLAKIRALSMIKRDEKELNDARKSFNINEEYLSALRTKSNVDFFSKAQLLVKEPSSPSFIHKKFFETLLEPNHETILTILESAILSKVPEIKALMLNYFDISAEASNICGHILKNINQVQCDHKFIQQALDVLIGEDYHSPEELKLIISELNSLHNPFSDQDKDDFRNIHDKYSQVLHHLKSKRKRVTRKIKLIDSVRKASGICVTAGCGLLAITAIILAAHSVTALAMGPLLISSFSKKCSKKKLFNFKLHKRKFLRKVREQLDVAAKGTYILNRDFDTMGRLVSRLHDEIENKKETLRFCLDRRDEYNGFSRKIVEELKKCNNGFRKQVEELEEHVYLCLVTINKARALVIKEITSSNCVE